MAPCCWQVVLGSARTVVEGSVNLRVLVDGSRSKAIANRRKRQILEGRSRADTERLQFAQQGSHLRSRQCIHQIMPAEWPAKIVHLSFVKKR